MRFPLASFAAQKETTEGRDSHDSFNVMLRADMLFKDALIRAQNNS